MTDFLRQMARSSAERVAQARARTSELELRLRCADSPPPPSLALGEEGFDLIAEVKLRSPSAGILRQPQAAQPEVVAQATAYAAGGAAAVSVLTEPTRFDGDLEHLTAVARAVPLPVLRKDFLVDPYQVLEARASGAAGVLLIVRLLPGARLQEMVSLALGVNLFVLLESFEPRDIERAAAEARRAAASAGRLLLGLNVRDLSTLAVDPSRLERFAPCFPPGVPRVAESGLAGPEDARRAAALGYRMGLAGEALMRAPDPARTTAALIEAGRAGAAQLISSQDPGRELDR